MKFDIIGLVIPHIQLCSCFHHISLLIIHQNICSHFPFHLSDSISKFPLELVQFDVWRPTHTLSISGEKFYVTFIDDFSLYFWLFPFLSHKFLLSSNILSWMLRTCLGGRSKPFWQMVVGSTQVLNLKPFHLHMVFFTNQLSSHTYTKWIRERKHRHIIVETGLSLMAHSSLSYKFWVDAFATAVFLINRLPTRTLGNVCSYEKLFQ